MTFEEFSSKKTLTNAEKAELLGGSEEDFVLLEKQDKIYDVLVASGIPSDRAAKIALQSQISETAI